MALSDLEAIRREIQNINVLFEKIAEVEVNDVNMLSVDELDISNDKAYFLIGQINNNTVFSGTIGYLMFNEDVDSSHYAYTTSIATKNTSQAGFGIPVARFSLYASTSFICYIINNTLSDYAPHHIFIHGGDSSMYANNNIGYANYYEKDINSIQFFLSDYRLLKGKLYIFKINI